MTKLILNIACTLAAVH